jgi:hypothetical protein
MPEGEGTAGSAAAGVCADLVQRRDRRADLGNGQGRDDGDATPVGADATARPGIQMTGALLRVPLFRHDGKCDTEIDMPAFRQLPDVIVWAGRVFILYGSQYREGFGYIAPVTPL